MPDRDIYALDPYPRHRVECAGVDLSYVDTGTESGMDAVVFLHGNPTCAYLWRNILPHLEPLARCLAPDLMGMGDSGKATDGSYRFVDHRRHLDAWFDAVVPEGPVTLVVHDWGSALGFHWAFRNQERIKGLAYMEALVRPLTWDEWPDRARRMFQGYRSRAGEDMVLTNNVFVERTLPGSTLRGISDEALQVYRRPYLEAGESRRPTLSWPRDIPIDGEPPDVVAIVREYADWLAQSGITKLFINAEPGAILTGAQREFCRSWPNQQEVTVPGVHFIQEDSPNEIGQAIAEWYQGIGG
ncbi:MAG: haloalkane dehalogenase [Chloroflexota bacterium]|nr:haloalkane dehalogenase [Chloroflexota bacterium]